LSSIRLLARDLKISVITTARAYTDLEQEGFIVNVQGKGCYVLPMNNDLVKEQLLRKIEDGLRSAIGVARIARISRKDLDAIWEQICEEEEYE
jgi:GntR family transcriptional regulator